MLQADHKYRLRFLTSLIAVLVLVIALVRWLPSSGPSVPEGPFREQPTDRIQVKEIQPTTQSQERRPPPPAPLPPVVVPENIPIQKEIEFGESRLSLANPEDDPRLQDGTAERRSASRQPDRNPRLFRAVQPDYPPAARENGVQARVQVSVQVSKTGRVEEATILKRWRLSDGGTARPVSQLEYGLEKAALGAARRSRFRPARKNGLPVASQTTITFEFGPSEN